MLSSLFLSNASVYIAREIAKVYSNLLLVNSRIGSLIFEATAASINLLPLTNLFGE
jgi:hypothetical protein